MQLSRQEYQRQIVDDVLEAKEKVEFAPIILLEWKPKTYSEAMADHIRNVTKIDFDPIEDGNYLVKGTPSGYVILREPTCRETELYGVLNRTMPTAAAEKIIPRHLLIDRMDKFHDRAGISTAIVNTLVRWSSTDPYVLNPQIENERTTSSPLSEFLVSYIYSIDPNYPIDKLNQTTYSQLLRRVFAVERTLQVITGGASQPFAIVTPEMLREKEISEEKRKHNRIYEMAQDPTPPPPPPPTLQEIAARERKNMESKLVPEKTENTTAPKNERKQERKFR